MQYVRDMKALNPYQLPMHQFMYLSHVEILIPIEVLTNPILTEPEE